MVTDGDQKQLPFPWNLFDRFAKGAKTGRGRRFRGRVALSIPFALIAAFGAVLGLAVIESGSAYGIVSSGFLVVLGLVYVVKIWRRWD